MLPALVMHGSRALQDGVGMFVFSLLSCFFCLNLSMPGLKAVHAGQFNV